MKYFGTNLTEHGHYIYDLNDNVMQRIGLDFNNLPFHPEQLTNNLPFGEVIYYQGGGFTVIGISGSPTDHRGGTKSIFWIDQRLTFDEMKQMILKIPIAEKLIDQMHFNVRWNI